MPKEDDINSLMMRDIRYLEYIRTKKEDHLGKGKNEGRCREERENHIQNRLTQWNVLETDAGNKRHRKTSIATVDDEEIDEEKA